MKTSVKIVIVALLAVTVATVVALKQNKTRVDSGPAGREAAAARGPAEAGSSASLPRLVDVGARKCIPCKMMAPILEELKKEYAGRLTVDFIDVWEKPEAATPYNVEIIPTQIFYDATGKERFRHVGFFGKEEILGKWKELGVELKSEDRNTKAEGTNRQQ